MIWIQRQAIFVASSSLSHIEFRSNMYILILKVNWQHLFRVSRQCSKLGSMSEGNGYHTLLFSIVALLGIFNVPRCLDISDTWYTAPTFIRSPCDRPGPVVFNQPLPKDIPRRFGGSRIRTCDQKLPPDYKTTATSNSDEMDYSCFKPVTKIQDSWIYLQYG